MTIKTIELPTINESTRTRFNEFAATIANQLPPFPANELGLVQGSIIIADVELPFFNLATGDELALIWDGEFVRHDRLTWSVEGIVNEIKHGAWVMK